MSPRTVFEEELSALKNNIQEMGQEVEKAYDSLFDAIKEKDRETIEALKRNDRRVNDMERKIESRCLALITKQQPVAKDLRMISAALKVVTDLERVGDNVADIADLILRLDFADFGLYSTHLETMIEETKRIIHDGVDAFINRDVETAKEFYKRDDVIDDLFNLVKEDLVNCLKKEDQNVDNCIDILMIAKYLEKMGDHAVIIAEWEVFRETGTMKEFRIF